MPAVEGQALDRDVGGRRRAEGDRGGAGQRLDDRRIGGPGRIVPVGADDVDALLVGRDRLVVGAGAHVHRLGECWRSSRPRWPRPGPTCRRACRPGCRSRRCCRSCPTGTRPRVTPRGRRRDRSRGRRGQPEHGGEDGAGRHEAERGRAAASAAGGRGGSGGGARCGHGVASFAWNGWCSSGSRGPGRVSASGKLGVGAVSRRIRSPRHAVRTAGRGAAAFVARPTAADRVPRPQSRAPGAGGDGAAGTVGCSIGCVHGWAPPG